MKRHWLISELYFGTTQPPRWVVQVGAEAPYYSEGPSGMALVECLRYVLTHGEPEDRLTTIANNGHRETYTVGIQRAIFEGCEIDWKLPDA